MEAPDAQGRPDPICSLRDREALAPPAEAVRAIRGQDGLDVVFDSLGGRSVRRAFDLLGLGGRLVTLGVASMAGARASLLRSLGTVLGPGRPHPLRLLSASRSLLGANMLRVAEGGPAILRRCLEGALPAVDDGILQPRLDRSFTADELATAREHLGVRRSAGKVTVTWS